MNNEAVKNGGFDTVGIFYAIKPDGEKVEINRFFKESEDGWKEINEAEYIKRLQKRYRSNRRSIHLRS